MRSGLNYCKQISVFVCAAVSLVLTACGGGASSSGSSGSQSDPPPATYKVSVALSGTGTVTSTPSGINCGSTCSTQFSPNTQVTLTASAANGFSFAGWTGGGCSGVSACTVTVTAATAIQASFTSVPSSALTLSLSGGGSGAVTSSPSGINCPSTCSAVFANGTQVTLTASPASGSEFGGWTGACSGGGTCVNTVNTPTSVGGSFSIIPTYTLTVAVAGVGTGTVSSSPAGINCPGTCSASYLGGTAVTLTASAGSGYNFGGWSGDGCSGSSTCTLTVQGNGTVQAGFGGSLNSSINHIIIFAQENRSFDHYFGALPAYWASNGFASQAFDGLAQFNGGSAPTVPGCDPAYPFDPTATPPETSKCTHDSASPAVASFHLQTMCLENPSPSWNESHVDWNLSDPVSSHATMNGFVHTAADDARQINPPMMDTNGVRAMGYYDGDDLNYYYFMASSFATSDRWFSPAMSRTQINRMYLLSATSQGHAYPLSGNDAQLSATTIYELLQNAGITWRIYIHPNPHSFSNGTVSCAAFSTTPICLYQVSYLNMFQYGQTVSTSPTLSQNLVPISQFATDAANGTLAQFSLIEPASASGLDEHPADYDPTPAEPTPCCSVQAGANYASGIINSLMTSPSWSDSALLFTYDEFGGFYDHVPPQPMPSPDGIAPLDLLPGDVCTSATGPTCNFVYTGYRVPLIIISPFSKQNYVSHVVADNTAMLKLVETRFGLPALTARDAAQIDMSGEFFDFVNIPWATPPTPPAQKQGGACTLTPPVQ